jgi:Leucine-rich repeat (LRR) protein
MLGSDRFQFETPNVIDPGDLPPSQPRRPYSDDNTRSPTSSTHSVSSNGSSEDDSEKNGGGGGGGGNKERNISKNVISVAEMSSYRHERNSSARLLNDINDLELSPRGVSGVPALTASTTRNGKKIKSLSGFKGEKIGGYRDSPSQAEKALRCEYGDHHNDDDNESDDYADSNEDSHDAIAASLPSVEEARSYAASLLDNAEKKYQNGIQSSSKQSLGLDRTVPIGGEPAYSMAALSQHFQLNGNGSNRHYKSKHLVCRRVSVLIAKVLLVIVLTLTAALFVVALVNSKKHKQSASTATSTPPTWVDDTAPSPATPPSQQQEFPTDFVVPSPDGGGDESSSTSLTRLESVVNFLSAGEISSLHDLSTPGSPQYLAAHWMANVDALQYVVPSHVQDDPDLFVQRYVLATFYYATQGGSYSGNSGGGRAMQQQGENGSDGNTAAAAAAVTSGWTDPLKFLSAEHECAWFELEQVVGFIDEAYAVGVTCSERLKVVNLFIPSNNLKGSLPSELRHLPDLTMLALPMNGIIGPIPDDLQYLTKLDYFDLKYNELQGSVPEFIGNIVTLEVLGLSNNKLSGAIPGAWSALSKLKTLALDDNKSLTGTLNFANHLTHLEFFYANGNQFTGVVDDNFLAAASLLKELDLSDNSLTCSIGSTGTAGTGATFPAHLLQHPTLAILDLAGNELECALPTVLSRENEYLQFLSLRNNRLTGSITATNLPMLTALTHLDLQGNGLTGEIAVEMVALTQLTYLFLGHNSFTVPEMPSWIYELTLLRELSMANVNMQLGIPMWLERLENLILLDLSNNAMNGKVPPELFQMPNLRFLLLNNNNLSGALPTTLANIPQLMILSLHKNPQIVGDMDHVCNQAPSLQLLGTDCSSSITCSEACCPTCCAPEQELCFVENIPNFLTWYDGMWEFGYKRASFGYDPAILDESHYFSATTLQDVSNSNNFTSTTPP